MENELETLRAEFECLENDFSTLEKKHSTLEDKHSNILKNHLILEYNYNKILERLNKLETAFISCYAVASVEEIITLFEQYKLLKQEKEAENVENNKPISAELDPKNSPKIFMKP